MRATMLLAGLGALLLLCGSVSAQCYKPLPQAPDMMGPGFPLHVGHGVILYPSYNVYPPFPPFQGMVAAPGAFCKDGTPYCGGPMSHPGCAVSHPGQAVYNKMAGGLGAYTAAFPNHLFARSPRDFYMIDVDPRTPSDYGLVRPYNPALLDRP